MGQTTPGSTSPDSGDTNSSASPSQQFVAYSQPPYPPQPVHYPLPMTTSRKPKYIGWIIGCSVAAGVVIILCALMTVAFFPIAFDPIGREVDAKTTIQNFCQEMQRQDYVRAYDYLSSAAKGRVGTVDQFKNRAAILDRSKGIVTSCVIDSDSLRAAATHSDGKRIYYVGIWVLRGNSATNDPDPSGPPVDLTLVHENNAWKVDDADPTQILY